MDPAVQPEQLPTGMIQGGWEYVWAAYGVSWAVLLAFVVIAILGATPSRLRRTP